MDAALLRFVMQRGILSPRAVVNGTCWCVTSRRDRFTLDTLSDHGEAVAVVKTAPLPLNMPYLAAEAAVLAFISRHPVLRGIAPAHLASDAAAGILAMEAVMSPGDAVVDVATAAETIGALHRETTQAEIRVTRKLPPIFDAILRGWTPKPDALAHLWHLSTDAAALRAQVGTAGRRWRHVCLVHTDVKREHWHRRMIAGQRSHCLIDWELVRVGDPAWDVASVLHDHALAGGDPARHRALPISSLEFLDHYRRAAGDAIWRDDFEERVAALLAVRLLQTALETLTMDPALDVRSYVALAERTFTHHNEIVAEIRQADRSSHAA